MCKLALSEEELAARWLSAPTAGSEQNNFAASLTTEIQNLHSFSERCNYLIFIFPEK